MLTLQRCTDQGSSQPLITHITAQRIYCSTELQTEDWPAHKLQCGTTEKVDLSSFFPFLAVLIESCRIHPSKPLRPALLRQLVNNPFSPVPTSAASPNPRWPHARQFVLGCPRPRRASS